MDFSYKKIWTITLPVLIGMLMEHLLGMTDAIFLGRVGEVEFGASGLGSVYFLAMLVVGLGFGMGAQILMARRHGQKQNKAIGHIFFQGTLMLLALAAVLIGLSAWLSPHILGAIIKSEEVRKATLSYVSVRSLGMFFAFTAIMFRAYYLALTKTKILTFASILMVFCNVIFNYVLIFGKLGLPAMGIKGAAIGSVMAEAVMCIFIIVYTRLKTDYKEYGMFRATRPSWSIQRQIWMVSVWMMIQYFLSCGTWFFFFIAVEHLGEHTLAQSNIVRQIASLLYLFVSAFATTGSSMVSNLMGAGQSEKVMPLCWRIVKMCSLCTLPLLIFAACFPGVIMHIYSDDWTLISAAIPSFMTMIFSYLFTIPGFVFFLAISGTGNTRASMLIEAGVLTAYVVFVWFTAMRLQADISTVWIAEVVYGVLMLTASYCYMRFARWREKVI